MRIGVEAVGNRAGGGAIVLLDVLSALSEHKDIDEIILFCSPRATRGFDLPTCQRTRLVELPKADRSNYQRILWHQVYLARAVGAMAIDRMLLMNALGNLPAKLPNLAFAQQPLIFPPDSPIKLSKTFRLRLNVIRYFTRSCLRRATLIGVQREGMANNIATAFGIPSGKIEIFRPSAPPFPEPSDPDKKLLAMEKIPSGGRLLYVGSNEPHKNLSVITAAVEALRDRFPEVTLFTTCKVNEETDPSGLVVSLGFLNRSELRRAYMLANFVVMPSKAESLGLPMLEAMSLGIPVLAANLPYAEDACGDAALYFDPNSSADAAKKIELLLCDENIRARLKAAGLANAQNRVSDRSYQRLVGRLLQCKSFG